MADVTLNVPVEYVPAFRNALLREIACDGEWLTSQAKEALDWIVRGKTADPMDHIDSPLMEVAAHTPLIRKVVAAKPGEALEVGGESQMLQSVLQAVCKDAAEHMHETPEDAATLAWASSEAVTV